MAKYDFMQPKIKFLEDDFVMLAHKLDEKYRPSTISDMAHIGTVLFTMMKLEERESNKPFPYRDEQSVGETHQTYHHNRMNEELHDSEYYYEMWQQTGDMNYKHMAQDELRHADFYIKHERMGGHSDGLESAKRKYEELSRKLA